MRKVNAVLVVLVLMLCSAGSWGAAGEKAPEFKLPTKEGEIRTLDDYQGKVVMLNFWASWCAPCRDEMPAMQALHEKYHDLGFTVVAINIDHQREKADRFLENMPLGFPILFDTQNKVSETYNLQAMPSTYFLDPLGRISHLHRGYRPGDETKYDEIIRSMLRDE